MTETSETKKERAVLVGLTAANMPEDDRSTETSMAELEALLETAGGEAAATVLQSRPSPDPRTFIGSGKAAEIKEIIDAEKLDLALFDNELSPSQARALSEELGVRVLDRSGIILDIFAGRARSREGRLQVELAQYKYLLPRLTGMWTHLVRQTASGGSSPIGTRGPGETQLETDRRHIRRRIQKLEEELEDVRRVRGTQRRVREKNETPVVALIGYTNAGKSTLLNAVTGESIQTGDRLFDTLDTTTRRFSPDGVTEALISDTVGFIRKLPTQLVEAFKATLEELVEAEVLLHVIDVSNPDWRAQARVVESLVAALGAGSIPRIDVYNKCDRAADYPAPGPGSVAISALTGRGLDELMAKIAEVLNAGVKRVRLLIPYSRASLLDTLHGECVIDSLEYTDEGVRAEVRCPAAVFPRIKDFVTGGQA